MAQIVQLHRMSSSAAAQYIGPQGEIIIDTGTNCPRIQDGATPGGWVGMLGANNLGEISNLGTARTNLGLGSAALLSSAVFTPTYQHLTGAGAGNYVPPAGCVRIEVWAKAAGGGGGAGGAPAGHGGNGTAGGDTIFNGIHAAGGNGGTGGADTSGGTGGLGGANGAGAATRRIFGATGGQGTGAGGTIAAAGGAIGGGTGGGTAGVNAVANSGAGGGGGSVASITGGAGGGGAEGEGIYLDIHNPGAAVAFTIGAKGTGGIATLGGAFNGGNGGDGDIFVKEYYV